MAEWARLPAICSERTVKETEDADERPQMDQGGRCRHALFRGRRGRDRGAILWREFRFHGRFELRDRLGPQLRRSGGEPSCGSAGQARTGPYRQPDQRRLHHKRGRPSRRGLHRYPRSVQRPSGRAFAGRLPGHAADARIPGARSLPAPSSTPAPSAPASGSTRSFMPSRPTSRSAANASAGHTRNTPTPPTTSPTPGSMPWSKSACFPRRGKRSGRWRTRA